jgi:hypothetical protein
LQHLLPSPGRGLVLVRFYASLSSLEILRDFMILHLMEGIEREMEERGAGGINARKPYLETFSSGTD